ncbi:hypothetical protein PSTG_15926 [Puccinia striiformis f. sp. tritici PST-78]|uniref:RRM domain-containing protein n=1 Tax=Puccinia striiformis f. sp. tritici PST-78 TaxID=1165861 RepID=A0A0L0UUA0_9BASI|nr:hypothetical protein PSTG_15926 [Puccinia striiformis f. sp. tritici PST-78]
MSCKIYVGNLAWATDENALGSHFTTIGEVKGAVVMRSEGRSRGFGFVTFAAPEQAKRAIDTMYDSELVSPKQIRIVLKTHGRRLRVNVANQLTRGAGGPGPTDYPMNGASAQGGYQYPAAPYPGGGAPTYGAYSHPPPPVQAPYMGGGYMNPNTYPGNDNGGYVSGLSMPHRTTQCQMVERAAINKEDSIQTEVPTLTPKEEDTGTKNKSSHVILPEYAVVRSLSVLEVVERT